jgi:hypothetical protein
MRMLSLESYPNREIRVTLCREPSAKPLKENLEYCDISPTCHSLKTLNTPTKPHREGREREGLPPGYGGVTRYQKFSLYGRRTLLRAGGALEDEHPYHECLFLTLTHPGSTRESMQALASYSAYAVQHLKAWLGRRIKANLSMYTWEWQRRGALHLHYVVHSPDEQVRQYIQTHLKEQWLRILDAIARESKVDIYRKHSGFSWASNKDVVRVDCQVCEKSVAAYLSKYISKATDNIKRMPKNAFCPSRWYGVSRPLLALLREKTVKITLSSLREAEAWENYEDCLSVLKSFAIKCYQYKHTVGSGKSIVSYVLLQERKSIWNAIMSAVKNTPDSSMNSEQKLRALVQQGVYAMKRSPTWYATFKQFCANSRPAHLISSPLSQDISRADLAFLVDMLTYTYRYTERTRFALNGSARLWYSSMKSFLSTESSKGDEWFSSIKL